MYYKSREEEEDDIAALMLREPAAAYGRKIFAADEYLEMEKAADRKHEY